MGRSSAAPAMAASLVSLSWWSPRRKTTTARVLAELGVIGVGQVGHVGHRLDLLRADASLRKAPTSSMVRWPGVWTSSGVPSPVAARSSTAASAAGGLLEVGGVAAGAAAGDQVFAGVGVDHELLRLRAAHGAGVGFDGDELQAAAGEDAAVGARRACRSWRRGRRRRCRRSRRPS